VIFEVLSADGNFVTVHVARFPNSQATVSITNPYLPMTVDVNNNATGSTNLTIITGCWVAGTSAPTISGGGLVAPINAVNANGNIGPATVGSSISAPTIGLGGVGIGISGTWSGTLTFQFSMDGNIWMNAMMFNPATGAFTSSTTTNGNFAAAVGSFRAFRVVCTAYTSGTAVVAANGNAAPSIINTLSAITDGANDGPVAVKPASTAAVAADAALVVALSPNNGVTTAATASTTTLLGAQAATSTLTQPTATTSSSSMLAANAARKGASVFNNGTVAVYLAEGATATTSAYTTQIPPGWLYEFPVPCPTGAMSVITASGSAALVVTERT
jgi:hypothetical protein